MSTKKILITGASSKTGEAITRIFKTLGDYELLLMSSSADIFPKYEEIKYFSINSLDKQTTKKLCMKERPDIIINCTAMTDVDQCEVDKRLAWELNVYVVENLLSTSHWSTSVIAV